MKTLTKPTRIFSSLGKLDPDWILILFFLSLFVCLFVFYGISTFVSYLMPNPFLYK